MRHPKRAITRDVRTRRPKRPGREVDEMDALTWPERAVRVKDVMTRPAVTIEPGATVGRAWKLMQTRQLRHLPVVDGAGTLLGMLTDRDLRQVILEPAIQEQLGNVTRALNVLTVREVMTWGVLTTTPATDIRQVARVMRQQRIGALPVVEGDRVVGMLTATDLVQALVAMMEEGVLSKPVRWRPEG
jgi:acetoin utilization protein AcuB